MLWFNNDTTLDLDSKITQAALYFCDKYGCWPTQCYIHPSMLNGRLNNQDKEALFIGEIELLLLDNVRPNHFWITNNGKNLH